MIKMMLKFLGTGGVCGVPEWNCSCDVCSSCDPRDKRLRPSVLIEVEDKNIVIDIGPDFRTQLLKYSIRRLDYVFLTHAHDDHRAGYAELSRQANLAFEAPKPVLKEFFKRLGTSRKWLEKRNPSLVIRPFEKKKIDDLEIETIELEHKKDYQGEDTPCYGYLFRTNKFTFAYVSDYSQILEKQKVRKIDMIISDGNGMKDIGNGHVGVEGSIKMFRNLKAKRMVLTHFTHSRSHRFMTCYVKKFGDIRCAYDGMEIKFK